MSRQAETTPMASKPANFKKPVAWLLGPQLLASMKRIALYAAFGEKLDPRDWMSPELINLDHPGGSAHRAAGDPFWFDFMADTGDGQMATYNIAALCLNNLFVRSSATIGDRVFFTPNQPGADKAGQCLPRGEFLFVGGDTSYHIADYPTLAERFQAPFQWAWAECDTTDDPPRPMFAIPGNHDWYDSLDGFNRQFRQELDVDAEVPGPQLAIPGFERRQSASYVALRLPFDWLFLGIDAQGGQVDFRQQHFFHEVVSTANRNGQGNKLIVAVPEPPTVFGKASTRDAPIGTVFRRAGLATPSLDGGQLDEEQVRLDLAGDVHHYARYWGPPAGRSADCPDTHPPLTPDKPAPSASNYASVVSGAGGAFHHPTQTRAADDKSRVEEQVLFPSPGASAREVATRLLNPMNIVRGGYVVVAGAVAALVFALGASVMTTTRSLLNLLPWIEVEAPAGLLAPLVTLFLPPPGVDPLHVVSASLLIVISIVFSGILFYLARGRADRTFTARAAKGERRDTRASVLAASASVLPVIGLMAFGGYPSRVLVADLFVIVLFACATAGVLAFAYTGDNRAGPWQGWRLMPLGLLHAALQLCIPVGVMLHSGPAALPVLVATIITFALVARWLASASWHGHKTALAALFFFETAFLVMLPRLIPNPGVPDSLFVLLAVPVGAFCSCVFLGQYLTVALAFDGHNNEAGGAARIEAYKQFVRIRLDSDSLTAWVIGFEAPNADARKLELRVIDTFTLRPGRSDTTATTGTQNATGGA